MKSLATMTRHTVVTIPVLVGVAHHMEATVVRDILAGVIGSDNLNYKLTGSFLLNNRFI